MVVCLGWGVLVTSCGSVVEGVVEFLDFKVARRDFAGYGLCDCIGCFVRVKLGSIEVL